MIRRLGPEDAAAYAEIRLEGLRLAPDAFGSDAETEQSWSVDRYADQLTRNAVFGFEEPGVLLGVAGFFELSGIKRCHRGVLWGMYVRADARGRGIGAQLIECVLHHARGRVEQVHLDVSVGNATALALYQRCGFRSYGIEPHTLKVDDRYIDTHMMVHILDSGTDEPGSELTGNRGA